MLAWLGRRLPEQTAAVKRIIVFCEDGPMMPLRSFPGLASVLIYCVYDGSHSSDLMERQELTEEVRSVWGTDELEIRIEHG
jgi:hypothetical protein